MHQFELCRETSFSVAELYVAQVSGIDNLTKVGLTGRTVSVRTREQNLSVICKRYFVPSVALARLIESTAHHSLRCRGYWLPPGALGLGREVFKCDSQTAIEHTDAAYKRVFDTVAANPDLCADYNAARDALGFDDFAAQAQLNLF